MKILFIHNKYQIKGGEDSVLENEIQLLKKNGHQIDNYIVSNNSIKSIYDNKTSFSEKEKLKRYYDLLGVNESDSMEIIKKKYRDVIKNYHPDKIQGKGLPEDFIDFANKKLIDFNEAYNEIRKNRK